MSSDNDPVPLEACTPPGTIDVTDRALKRAAQFQSSVPLGWIVAFSWYEGSRSRASKDAPWVDQGPGLDLGAYRIGQIPKEAICHTDSLSYAVLIWKEIVDRHPKRTIDLDERGNPVLL
jgi:hypothetical protein